ELTGNLDSQAATLFDSVGEQAASARQRAVETIENSRLGLLVIGLVAIAVTVSIGWIYVVRKVAAPLDALTAATYRLAEGDLEVEIPLEGDRDLARLARTMEIFRHNAKLVTRQGAELRERSNEDLQQFAYVSAHDMREPLRTIAMYLGLLKTRVAERLDDTESRHFQYVIDAAVRMDALVRGQLSFSKLTRVPAVRELVDVGEELDFVCQDLRAVIDDKGAEVRWGTLPQITGESAQLRQLLQNLISNSLKFNVSRNPVIEIIGEPKDTHWEFSLTDNGVGVPARDVPKLFNLFYRGYSHEDYSGTGIGLAIARRVVENHGGQIWLDADYSPGARFVFTISREEVIPIENS
ncbi:MAG: HAMP domain-containing protein, partial [Gammaproteobacteria bacterium]|nr:HAMP domain-containing protein [Gammaproteobacteria bacterium]